MPGCASSSYIRASTSVGPASYPVSASARVRAACSLSSLTCDTSRVSYHGKRLPPSTTTYSPGCRSASMIRVSAVFSSPWNSSLGVSGRTTV